MDDLAGLMVNVHDGSEWIAWPQGWPAWRHGRRDPEDVEFRDTVHVEVAGTKCPRCDGRGRAHVQAPNGEGVIEVTCSACMGWGLGMG